MEGKIVASFAFYTKHYRTTSQKIFTHDITEPPTIFLQKKKWGTFIKYRFTIFVLVWKFSLILHCKLENFSTFRIYYY